MLFQCCKIRRRAALLAAIASVLAAWQTAAAEPLPCHGAPTPYKLYITVQGVRSNHGYIVANLYGTDRSRWLADNRELGNWRDPATPGDETMCLYLSSPGRYAVVVFHDANANGVLDMGPLGPKEAFGFSNNVRPFLAPPPLRSALFEVGPGETHIAIRLRYPPQL